MAKNKISGGTNRKPVLEALIDAVKNHPGIAVVALIISSFSAGLGAYEGGLKFVDIHKISADKLEELTKKAADLDKANEQITQLKQAEGKRKWQLAVACLPGLRDQQKGDKEHTLANRGYLFQSLCTLRSLSLTDRCDELCDLIIEQIAMRPHDPSKNVFYDVPISVVTGEKLDRLSHTVLQEAIQNGVQP
jgi:hypothetical protein